jgi:LacI family transcriptional regulator
MIIGVERAAKQLGYKLMFSEAEEASADDIQTAIDNVGNVDGVLVITPIQSELHDYLVDALKGNHYVQIGTRVGSKTPSVVIDQAYGSQLATQHLIDLGHRQIAEISGPLYWNDAIARHQSWLATLQANQLEPVASVEGDWTAAGGYNAAGVLLDSGVAFTGLIVGNDQMALGAIRALRERGLSIPEDISIVGFDDIPESAYFEPPLTTLRQDFTALGRQSVEYLVEMIKQPRTPLHQRILYPTFVERQSTTAVDPGDA